MPWTITDDMSELVGRYSHTQPPTARGKAASLTMPQYRISERARVEQS